MWDFTLDSSFGFGFGCWCWALSLSFSLRGFVGWLVGWWDCVGNGNVEVHVHGIGIQVELVEMGEREDQAWLLLYSLSKLTLLRGHTRPPLSFSVSLLFFSVSLLFFSFSFSLLSFSLLSFSLFSELCPYFHVVFSRVENVDVNVGF